MNTAAPHPGVPWRLLGDLCPAFGVRTPSAVRRACIASGIPLVRVGRRLAVRSADLETFAAGLQPVAGTTAPLPQPVAPEWARALLKRGPRGHRDLAPKRRRGFL